MDVATARDVVFALYDTIDFAMLRGAPLAVPERLYEMAEEAAADVQPWQSPRITPAGQPMDFLAPSAWHAASFLVLSDLTIRIRPAHFESAAFEVEFGNRSLYRGQARGWHIMPRAWRSPFPYQRAIYALRCHLESFMDKEDALELDLIGRLYSDIDAVPIAQHYGIPTDLVDFTFDPMVAIFFALAATDKNSQDDIEPKDMAVVYATTWAKLLAKSTLAVRFPPIQARRLYRQSGVLVDFGQLQHGTSPEFDLKAPWTHVEAMSVRVMFPRTYPETAEHRQFNSDEILDTDKFFEDEVAAASRFARAGLDINEALTFMQTHVKSRPPWRVKKLDRYFLYTDNEFAALASVLERYLTRAALIQMKGRTYLDPIVVGAIGQSDRRILEAIHKAAGVAQHMTSEYTWIMAEIDRSLTLLNEYIASSRGPAHNA